MGVGVVPKRTTDKLLLPLGLALALPATAVLLQNLLLVKPPHSLLLLPLTTLPLLQPAEAAAERCRSMHYE